MNAVSRAPMLVFDASSGASAEGGARCLAAIVDARGQAILAETVLSGPGGAANLAAALPDLLKRAGVQGLSALGAIACVVGPGSFTGLRATLALAAGIAAGSGCSVLPVTVGEAFGIDLDPGLAVATMARRGRAFVERGGAAPVAIDLGGDIALARPACLAGDGAAALAGMWPSRPALGVTIGPSALDIAGAALRRRAGALPPRPALPLYVDAPEAKLPPVRVAPA